MAALSSSFIPGSVKNPRTNVLSASSLMTMDHCQMYKSPGKARVTTSRRSLAVRAGRDGGKPSNASIFVGGFVLGGIVVGALGAVYAPQISKALAVAGADRKDLMRKLPKFIYDEEKALERTRKVLAAKIEQLNSAIDEVSSQLRADDSPNGSAVNSDGIEASI